MNTISQCFLGAHVLTAKPQHRQSLLILNCRRVLVVLMLNDAGQLRKHDTGCILYYRWAYLHRSCSTLLSDWKGFKMMNRLHPDRWSVKD